MEAKNGNAAFQRMMEDCNKDVQFSPDCSSGFSNVPDACVIVLALHRYINFHYLRA